MCIADSRGVGGNKHLQACGGRQGLEGGPSVCIIWSQPYLNGQKSQNARKKVDLLYWNIFMKETHERKMRKWDFFFLQRINKQVYGIWIFTKDAYACAIFVVIITSSRKMLVWLNNYFMAYLLILQIQCSQQAKLGPAGRQTNKSQ